MREKVYTQVEFLGSILGKTAFDLMLERSDTYDVSYQNTDIDGQRPFLDIKNEKQDVSNLEGVPSYEKYFDSVFYPSLLADKVVPDILLKQNRPYDDKIHDTKRFLKRKVIYRPDPLIAGYRMYGTLNGFEITFKVMASPEGKVIRIEQVNTTGYQDLDIGAMESLKEQVFEYPKGADTTTQWIEVDVTIKMEPTEYGRP